MTNILDKSSCELTKDIPYTTHRWATGCLKGLFRRNRADSRFAPSQWEMPLLCNDISHWLGASLEKSWPCHNRTLTGWICSAPKEICAWFVVCCVLLWFPASLFYPLQWRHNECDGISNHQRFDRLLNCLFRHRSKKTSKLYITVLCEGNPLVTDGIPSQRATNEENVFIWSHHHVQDNFIGSIMIAPVAVKQPWRIWINESHWFTRNS